LQDQLDSKNRRRLLGRRPRGRNRSLRARPMSRRGRMTLFVLGCTVGLSVGTSLVAPHVREFAEASSRSSGRFLSEDGRVAAPDGVFARLPVGAENAVYAYSEAPGEGHARGVAFASVSSDPFAAPRLAEVIPAPLDRPDLVGPLRVEYSVDAELTKRVFRILRHSRVERGHVIVLDPDTGRVLTYASTDPEGFPPTRAYPAASLVKVVTADALLESQDARAHDLCLYRGNPYRLRPGRFKRTQSGRRVSLEMALATSNNQCFAQYAVHDVGSLALLDAVDRFGWLDQPAPGHDAGTVDPGTNDYQLGKLGSGLAGSRITPLHAARLAATLVDGESVEPWWVDRVVDAAGNELAAPPRPEPRRVLSPERAEALREMMVRTTTRGTARSAFRDRRGRPKLGPVLVSGKTGNISGGEPRGRYEWFVGAAPAEDPSVVVAVVQVHGHLWWKKSSEIAAAVLQEVFCEKRRCDAELAHRYTGRLGDPAAPIFLSESGR